MKLKTWKIKLNINQKDLKYETDIYIYLYLSISINIYIYIYIYIYLFQQFEKTRSFGDSIYTGKINIDVAEMDQSNLLKNMIDYEKIRKKEGNEKETLLIV